MSVSDAKKSLGQHWLNDEASLKAICASAEISKDDLVLEIGPGHGDLTKVLASYGAKVFALEYDIELVPKLEKMFAKSDVSIEHGDIRKFNFNRLPEGYKVVANIPYYLTANLLRLLTETENKPSLAVLLVQREVAQRIAAKPGQMSFISVALQLYYEVSLGAVVPARLFEPPPKVDSQVLILKRLNQLRFTDIDYMQLIKFMKIGFSQPRKTLANNFSNGLKIDRSIAEGWLKKTNLKLTVRAQELSLRDWHKLYILSN